MTDEKKWIEEFEKWVDEVGWYKAIHSGILFVWLESRRRLKNE